VQYPTIAHLLANYATTKLAADLRPWIALAHAQHRQIRVDELNSEACRGRSGISDTFAGALWVTDALFSPAAVGVDGVSVHTLPNAAYQLFRFSDAGGRRRGRVQPVFYGVQLLLAAPLAAPAAWAADGSDVVTVTGGSAALVTVGR
jgi:hypothetical protein